MAIAWTAWGEREKALQQPATYRAHSAQASGTTQFPPETAYHRPGPGRTPGKVGELGTSALMTGRETIR